MSKKTERMSEADKEIIRRLDAVLGVLLELSPADGKKWSVSKRIEFLGDRGYRSNEIGKIVGRSTAFVGVILNRYKRRTEGRHRR